MAERDHDLDRAPARTAPVDRHDGGGPERDERAFPTNTVAADLLGRVHRAGGASDDSPSQGAGPLDPAIAARIAAERGGGVSLAEPVRSEMEATFGADLSAVRIHDDARADALSRSVQAEAFTTGADIFFKAGRFAPGTTDGRGLLGHELTHVVQQATGATAGENRVSHPDDPHEVEAAAVGRLVAGSPSPPVTGAAES